MVINLEDAYLGKNIKYINKRQTLCTSCEGIGGTSPKPCISCKGQGMTQKMMMLGPGMYQQMSVPCNDCLGEGKIIEEENLCSLCKGKKMIPIEKELEVILECGVPQEYEYLFEGEGEEQVGFKAGDLYLRVMIENHAVYKRIGADLSIDKDITLLEALCGVEFEIPLLNGEIIVLATNNEEVIHPNDRKMIKGKGMPFYKDKNQFGNLIINFKVQFPKKGDIDGDMIKALKNVVFLLHLFNKVIIWLFF